MLYSEGHGKHLSWLYIYTYLYIYIHILSHMISHLIFIAILCTLKKFIYNITELKYVRQHVQVLWSVQGAITEYQTEWLINNRNVSHSFRDWTSKIRMTTWLSLGECPLPDCKLATFWILTWWKEWGSSSGSHLKGY